MNFLEFYTHSKQYPEFLTTDKNDWGHTYVRDYYNKKFTPLKEDSINLLEIGNYRGDSLRMFRGWFSNAKIYGIEANPIIHDKEKSDNVYVRVEPKYDNLFINRFSESYVSGCYCYMMDAYHEDTLSRFENDFFDIIIDDGSHLLKDQIYAVTHWIKKLKPGGTLIIEDIQDISHCDELKKYLDDTVTVTVHDLRIPGQTTPDNVIFEVIKQTSNNAETEVFSQFFEYTTTVTETVPATADITNHDVVELTAVVTNKPKILVAQYYTENLSYGEFSEDLNRKYCELHGYDYVVEKDDLYLRTFARDEEIALQWYKVPFLSKLMEEYPDHDWIMFMDADAVFSNVVQTIENFCDDEHDVILSTSEVHHCITNTGVILIRNNEWSRQFVKDWWEYRNTSSGKDVNETLGWNGGMHAPDNGSIFKSSLWHEQTCLTLMYRNHPEIQSHFKFVDEKVFNSHIYNPKGFIFHAFPYSFDKNRSIDIIHEARTSSFERTNKITVVYFVYCINDYLTRAKNDFARIIKSGLYNDLFDLHIVASLPDRNSQREYDSLSEIFSGYDKVVIHKVYDNKFEHFGVVRAWLESHKSDGQILYFHAKGVTAIYTDTNPHTEWKRKGDESFLEMLKYFMIDNYKHCLYKLEVYDQVNVSDSYSRGWPSGNFWWANKVYLRENPFPWESTYDRWASEAWINFRRTDYTMFQFYERFGFRDKFTFIPEASYKAPHNLMDKKMNLVSAKLMTLLEPENENDRNRPTETNEVDVSNFITQNLQKNNYKGIDNVIVSLRTFGDSIEDRAPEHRKCLIVEFTVDGDDTVYRLAADEGQALTYRIDRYNAIGYMFHRNHKLILENINASNIQDVVRLGP